MLPTPHQPLAFAKYQATGNDFILLDWTVGPLPDPDVVRALCDRRFGIGADGVLLVTRRPADSTVPTMLIFNADGSRPEMCGNGLRCAALHLARTASLPTGTPGVIATDAGLRQCEVRPGPDLDRRQVAVAMGPVRVPSPCTLDNPSAELLLTSLGNPHAVLLSPTPAAAIDTLGPALSTHPAFPNGVNVGFVQAIGPQALELVVWERGAGKTLACGTGACAAVAAAWHAGRLTTSRDVRVRLPGGTVVVDLDPDTRQARLTGEAAFVFEGVIPWPRPTP
jgi:diaminopimelate epimerase